MATFGGQRLLIERFWKATETTKATRKVNTTETTKTTQATKVKETTQTTKTIPQCLLSEKRMNNSYNFLKPLEALCVVCVPVPTNVVPKVCCLCCLQ